MNVEGKRSLKLSLNGVKYVIQEVYYVPELKNNLLSIGQFQQKGLSFLFQSDACRSSMSTNRMYPLSEDTNEITEQKTDGCLYSSDDDVANFGTKDWDTSAKHA
ncbi:hypothetical protein LXL04_024548 [Taraxacum kok-saghyz]